MNDITIKFITSLMENIMSYKYKKDKEKLSQVNGEVPKILPRLAPNDYKMKSPSVSAKFYKLERMCSTRKCSPNLYPDLPN